MTAQAEQELRDVDPGLGSQARRRIPRELVDAGAVVLLTTLALVGFHASFGGWIFLASGVAGCLLGAALAWFAWRLVLPAVTLAATALVTVAVMGGVLALRATALAGVVPTVETLRGLAQGFTRGWLDLATTPPPAGDVGNLLAIPYLCGFLSGVIALSIALRDRRPLWAVLPPALVLAASIFTGVESPVSVLAQGAAFGLVAIGWWSWRASRSRAVVASATGWSRAASAVALLAVAAVGALFLGPRLPGSEANDRLLLRQYVEPELDLSRYPSPLAGVRKYLMTQEQREQVLFTVSGLPGGTPVRLAVMDTWDGTVAGVAGTVDATSSGQFRRVGSTVPTTVTGQPAQVQIEVKGYNDYWVPTVGGTAGVVVEGSRAEDVTQSFFYNSATDSAITTSGLTTGDRIVLDSVLPAPVPAPQDLVAATVPQPGLSRLPDPVVEMASDLVGDGGTPYVRAQAVADFLRGETFYTPHGTEFDRPPGHGFLRLDDLAGDDQWVGDEEQYGALAMLMSREVQVPTRLVMGFRDRDPATAGQLSGPWDVTGSDLDVWLEVGLADAGWVPLLDVSPPRDKLPAKTEEPKPKPRPEVQVPPKPEPEAGSESAAQDLAADEDEPQDPEDSSLPAWVGVVALAVGVPLLVIALYSALILGLKRRRRTRRRTHPDPGVAIAGGWDEVLDSARDSGVAGPPPASTRREVSRHLAGSTAGGTELLEGMARRADAAVFAPVSPSQGDVEDYWEDVQTADRSWVRSQSRWRRIRSRLSPRSLRGSRRSAQRSGGHSRSPMATQRSGWRPWSRRRDGSS